GRGEAPPAEPAIARLTLASGQTLAEMRLSGDEKFVWLGIDEKPAGNPRTQDVPNYVTTSSYPEMIPGRTDVGDVQPRRRLAMLDLATGKTTWADASTFAGVERKSAASD